MIFWIITGLAGLLLVGRKGSATLAAGSTPVIHQATGVSLTNALGTTPKPPAYYQSGNPGYNTTPPTSTPISLRPVSAVSRKPVMARSSAPGRVAPVVIAAGTSATQAQGSGPVKPIIGAFVNVRQMNRNTTAPELTQPFWTPNPKIPRRS